MRLSTTTTASSNTTSPSTPPYYCPHRPYDHTHHHHHPHHHHLKQSERRRRSNSLPGWAHPFPPPPQIATISNGRAHILRASERRVSFVEVELSTSEDSGMTEYLGHSANLTRTSRSRDPRKNSTITSINQPCWRRDSFGDTQAINAENDIEQYCDTVDFALETSLHGLKYICQPERHIVERIFWMIAFGIGLTMAGWLISDVWNNYLSSPLIVTFEPFETTIDKIPFPAITICNMNKVLKSKAEEYIRLAQGPEDEEVTIEARKNVYYLDHVCSSSKSFSQKFNYSSKRGQVDPSLLARTRVEDGDDEQRDVARFLQLASQPCEEMLLLCAWQDTTYNCTDLFKPIETDFGKCCTFNMIPHLLLYKNMNEGKYDAKEVAGWSRWDIENNGLLINDDHNDHTHSSSSTTTPMHHYSKPMPFPRRQKRAGKSSGLSVLLNPEVPEYFCTSSDSHGFQLVKHLPIDNPKVVDFGIAIRPNAEVFMGVKPEITMADVDIYNFKLEKRNCYFYGEFPLAYYKIYTSSNCYDECLSNQTYEICGCVSYYMPRDDTRDLCGASSFQCAEHLRKSALQSGIKSRCDFCLPACTELEYFSETTFTPLQDGDAIWIKDSSGIAGSTTTAPWSRKNLSIVHIYFASDSSYARVRKELYGLTDLIANTGGLMGLCLGFSGLSLVEVIYFYTLRAWCRSKSRARIRSQQSHRDKFALRNPIRWPMAKKLGEMLAGRQSEDKPKPKLEQFQQMGIMNFTSSTHKNKDRTSKQVVRSLSKGDDETTVTSVEGDAECCCQSEQPPRYAELTTQCSQQQRRNFVGRELTPTEMVSASCIVGACQQCHFMRGCCCCMTTASDGYFQHDTSY